MNTADQMRTLSLIRGFFDAVDIRREGLIELEDLVWFLDDAPWPRLL
jgi:hypothetical protein